MNGDELEVFLPATIFSVAGTDQADGQDRLGILKITRCDDVVTVRLFRDPSGRSCDAELIEIELCGDDLLRALKAVLP